MKDKSTAAFMAFVLLLLVMAGAILDKVLK